MRLKKTIQEKIKRNVQVKNRLALAFVKSGYTIERWIDENEENGDLTKAMAVQIISEELEVNDSEVLEETESVRA
jgi:hypothetical protein